MLKKISLYLSSKIVLFIVNFIFGLVFILLIFVFEKTSIIEDLYNLQLDVLVNKTETSKKINDGDIAFKELNEKFFKDWNATDSSITPRDGLASVINNIVIQKPKVMFVDIFLHNNKELDKNLTNTIKSIVADKNNTTKFVFIIKQYMNKKGDVQVKYPYFREELKAFEGRTIFYGISNSYNYGDTTVKRYFDFFKDINGKRLYNIPVLVKVLMEDREEVLKANNTTQIKFDNYLLDLSQNDSLIENRINFYIFRGWTKRGKVEHSPIDINNMLLTNINYANKAVFIGVNEPIMGDIHKTPIGEMAGVYLLGNSYLTLNNSIKSISNFWKFFILLLTVLIMSYFLTIYDSIISMIFTSVIAIGILVSLNWLLWGHGIFISILVPLFYIFKHRDFAELLESVIQKGLSWIEWKLNKKEEL